MSPSSCGALHTTDERGTDGDKGEDGSASQAHRCLSNPRGVGGGGGFFSLFSRDWLWRPPPSLEKTSFSSK